MNYYVYTWTDPRNGEVFYIGKGLSKKRAYACHSTQRCGNRRAKIISEGYHMDDIVCIIQENLTEDKALELEEQLINQYKIIEDGGTLFNHRTKGLKAGSWRKIRKAEQVREVCELYASGLTMLEIGKKFNVHETTIRLYLQQNNITARAQGYTTPAPENWNEIHRLIVDKKLSMRKAQDQLSVTFYTIKRLMRDHPIVLMK